MAKKYTRFTNLEVTGEMKSAGGFGITKATYASDSTKTLPSSMSASYTQAEQTKILQALDDLRTKYDKLVSQLATGSDT